MLDEARASHIAERVIFGGSFVCAQPEPNDFDCIVVLQAGTRYETLQPFQRWGADTREASRDESAWQADRSCRGNAMIASHAQLKVTQEQIQRLEYALAELRRTAAKAEFAAQAPAIIEHIRRMREEIDTYLGMYDVETTSLRP
jgi:hypothetical protein